MAKWGIPSQVQRNEFATTQNLPSPSRSTQATPVPVPAKLPQTTTVGRWTVRRLFASLACMSPSSIGGRAADDPCAALRQRVTERCAEALRLAEVAGERAAELRRERHTGARLDERAEASRLTERGAVAQAKEEAHRRYREKRRPGAAGIRTAAAEWLREIDRLNRAVRDARPQSVTAAQRRGQSDASLDRLTLAADAARIAADEAAERCQAARIELARCDETHAAADAGSGADAARRSSIEPDSTLLALVRGDGRFLDAVAERTAAVTGLATTEARRLLTLLSTALTEAALVSGSLTFSPENAFWRQFPPDDGRRIALALAALGNGFDGRGGWLRPSPDLRLLSMALAEVGYDVRGVRHPTNAAEMQALWEGTAIDVVELLAVAAPELSPEAVSSLVGRRAPALGGLWDRWGSVRPLLLAAHRPQGLRP